jgi:hypothetical protein
MAGSGAADVVREDTSPSIIEMVGMMSVGTPRHDRKTHQIMNRELHAVIMPGGKVRLEWSAVEERTHKSRQLMEQEIFRRFSEDRDSRES